MLIELQLKEMNKFLGLLILSIILALFTTSTFGQAITGVLMDESENPLPFGTVYIQGTSSGTSTNAEGYFSLNLEEGDYTLVFKYVGYSMKTIPVEYRGTPLELKVKLSPRVHQFNEVVVSAGSEDPAYEIIRKAQDRRLHFLNAIPSFTSKVYIKGTYYLDKHPDSFLGNEFSLQEFTDIRDTADRPVVYLAESESQYFKMLPNHRREIVLSSKVSGDSRGFGFNSALLMDINLYESEVQLLSTLKSPVAPGSFRHYDYKLVSASPGGDGELINKIELIPKNAYGPAFSGYIYIRENSWNIVEADIYVTKDRIQNDFLDTVRLSQVYLNLENDNWVLFQQNLEINAKVFGFEINGGFSAIFSDFDLEPDIDRNFFRGELIGFDSDFNPRADAYWDSIRPMPLLSIERLDYQFRDSLEEVRLDPAYLNARDSSYNRFKWGDILWGYDYRKSTKNMEWMVDSPLGHLSFNTVQGFNLGLRSKITFENFFNEGDNLSVDGIVNYGFSDQNWVSQGRVAYQFDKIKETKIGFSGGSKVKQFNNEFPISSIQNALSSLLWGNNYAKYYKEKYISFFFESRPLRWLKTSMNLAHSNRSPLFNQTDYSFRSNPSYTSNNPQNPESDLPGIIPHTLISADLELDFYPGVRYVSFPDRRIYSGSRNWPKFSIYSEIGSYEGDSEIAYWRTALKIDYSLRMGLIGRMKIFVQSSIMLKEGANLQFTDFQHFGANQTHFTYRENLHKSFYTLPYYEFSTRQDFVEFHMEHDFEGSIMRKIPVLKKWNLNWVTGAKGLYTHKNPWHELYLGLDNLGVGPLRIFRIDVIASLDGSKYKGLGWMVAARINPSKKWYH